MLVQVDDATGKTLGHVARLVIASGARNLQILGTKTNNRAPRYADDLDTIV